MKVPSVLQVNVSRPKIVNWGGNKIATGIFKEPVLGKILARRLNLAGDEQADLTVHGGPDKAVYCYPVEHYDHWKAEYPERDLEWGIFGENLTVSGFDEASLCIGDQLKIGDALFAVSQPRMPCFKLGIRFGDPSIMKRFYKSGKWGFYLSVLEEGAIEVGAEIIVNARDPEGVRLADVTQCFLDSSAEPQQILRVLRSKLAEQMKEQLESRTGILRDGSS